MHFLNRLKERTPPASMIERVPTDPESKPKVTILALGMGAVASIGGLIFGYVSGQISGFFLMEDYAHRFGELQPDGTYFFSAARQGTIVALLPAGALFGALAAGKLADWQGRRMAISASAFFSCIGTVIEISADTSWVQFAIGRLINGLGIGALSVAVPMYQSESAPDIIRGMLTASYQLALTFGILLAEAINLGTHNISSSASWRIPNGLSFLWALILGTSMLFLPESPRYAYRKGRDEEARTTIARLAGLNPQSRSVNETINGLRVSLDQENAAAAAKWHEIFTGPRMAYRTILGAVLQAGQQLTGANFFFYYGTSVFAATGLSNSYVTQLILGAVNFVCTLGGLYVVQHCGRRKTLMIGAAWMCMCFLVFSFVGRFALNEGSPMKSKAAGNILIVFSCLFIAAFATTWGPLIWGIVAELYPSKYRAQCMALTTSSNWLLNFLLSFFTRFITNDIGYLYGLVFAGCCAAMVSIVFFCLIEPKDRSLEEIDTMYVLKVNPITSKKWDGSRVDEEAEKDVRTDSDATTERRASVLEPRSSGCA